MENNRNKLAEKLEVVGGMFEIDGMSDLLAKFEPGMSNMKFGAVLIQVESLLMKENQHVADKIVAMNKEISLEEVAKMDDVDYTNALKGAIVTDVLGFFASSAPSDGRK